MITSNRRCRPERGDRANLNHIVASRKAARVPTGVTFGQRANGGDGSGAVTMTSGISLRAPGAILLISCYELGHQPLGAAWPRAFLERAGYAPDTLDLAVEPLDEAKVRRARLAGIAVPMHTALRIGTRAAERIRELNPGCLIVFYGLYALLNQDYLLGPFAEAVLGGEFEGALVRIAERIEAGEDPRARCAAAPAPPAAPAPAAPDGGGVALPGARAVASRLGIVYAW